MCREAALIVRVARYLTCSAQPAAVPILSRLPTSTFPTRSLFYFTFVRSLSLFKLARSCTYRPISLQSESSGKSLLLTLSSDTARTLAFDSEVPRTSQIYLRQLCVCLLRNCHWIMNFHKRTDNLLHQISLPSDLNLQGAIPKWHLLGHNPVCYVRDSLDHKQYIG
ncbi:hypothetical protein FRC12_024911 [Ceratobasidium sp. 428]|nr:hypothetical protein FRC12_024911 [Ceratobasidium sp. 428]